MPYYQFSATDPQGRQRTGQIQAQNAGEALKALMGQGLSTPRILSESIGQSAAPRRQQAPHQIIQQTQAARRTPTMQQPQGQVQINMPTAVSAPQVRHTKRSTDKDRYFLFTQIAEQLRAGIGPMQMFSELSQMYKDPKFRESLGMIAVAASEGRSISNVMELWPDLYPDHVVGLMRAGEAGGFMPDAAATISEQSFNAHKFKIFHAWWLWLFAVNLLSIPLVYMFRQSLLSYVNTAEAGQAKEGDLFAVFRVMGHYMIWPWGPVILLIIALFLGARHYLMSNKMKRFRHEMTMRAPVLGRRARDESSTIFSWVLSRLTKSGVPPNRSWELAMNSVPNLGMQTKLAKAGRAMTESSRFSDVIFRSELFPQEYAPMVATGELTGDIPGALEKLAQVSRAEYDTGTVKSKVFTSTAGVTGFILLTGFVTIVVAWVWFHEVQGVFINQANGAEPPAASSQTGSSPGADGPSGDLANPDR